MTASTQIFEGFSVTRACILNGTTAAESAQMYGVRTASLSVNNSTFDNTGDDTVLSKWFWSDYATVTVDGGFLSFPLLAAMGGQVVTSSGVGPQDYYATDLWNANFLNQPTKPMLVRTLSRDSNKVVRTLDFVLYQVQFQMFNFTGPAYKTGLAVNYSGTALFSTVDELGNTLPGSKRAIGRIVSSPGTLVGAVTAPYGEGS